MANFLRKMFQRVNLTSVIPTLKIPLILDRVITQ